MMMSKKERDAADVRTTSYRHQIATCNANAINMKKITYIRWLFVEAILVINNMREGNEKL